MSKRAGKDYYFIDDQRRTRILNLFHKFGEDGNRKHSVSDISRALGLPRLIIANTVNPKS